MKSMKETISFDLIQNKLKTYIKSEYAERRINELQPLYDSFYLERELRFLKEMISFIASYGSLPIVNSILLEKYIEYAYKGGILSPQELSYIVNDINNTEQVLDFISKSEGDYPLLKEYIRDFASLKHLLTSINNVVSPSLTIFDNASRELQSIRLRIIRTEASIKSTINTLATKYKDLLTEGGVTLRNGHYVLPVKNSEKNKVLGIVHDISSSGMTIFIEPSSLVELNNSLLLLHQEEEDEIKRILQNLTKLVLLNQKDLLNNNTMLGELDFASAKASYALETNSYVASISKTPMIKLKGARHPHIDQKKVVKNDFYLDENNRILVLSGPNAGGKTVAMKCVGLLSYMHQCGLALPTDEEGILPIFDCFLCDIGDQQSLNDNLSTFSGHMESLKNILATLTKHSLVLIDEIGTGTDPLEGEALAVSLIKAIKDKGALTIISSHFSGVKEYAFNNEGVLIGSMIFDEENLLPTYRLKVGIPGKSYALDVAKRHGLPEYVIDFANEYLKNSHSNDNEDKISYLEKMIIEYEKKIEEIKQKEIKISEAEREMSDFYASMDDIKKKMISDFEKEKHLLLEEVHLQIEEILLKLKNGTLKYHEALELKKKVDSLEEINDDFEEENDTSINVGDYILVIDNNLQGRVTIVNKNNITFVSEEGFTFNIKKNKVKKIKPPKKKVKKTTGDPIVMTSLSSEHNVIGMHVDDALESVAKYLDSARVRRFKSVRIIHGVGTGALRKAIHNYLDKQSFVDSYRLGNSNEGGLGATVVNLK